MKQKKCIPLLLLTGVLCFFSGCTKDLTLKYLVYSNDFENGQLNYIVLYDLAGPIPAATALTKTEDFNGSKVLGRFNNNTVAVNLSNMPTHNAVQIEFDLYIHDKWDGNVIGPSGKPDIWQFTADNTPYIIATFSNTNNITQSYPNFYGVSNPSPAKANSILQNLSGVCSLKAIEGGTSMYHIVKTVAHSGPYFGFTCNDALQPVNSLCTKSWSIDNIYVTAIKY